MIRLVLALLLSLAFGYPAEAHRLKVFARVEGATVRGYAFFIGGGRPHGAKWAASDSQGNVYARGLTDAEGTFGPVGIAGKSRDVTITVDTGEGHIANARLPVVAGDGAGQMRPAAPLPDAGVIEAAVERQVAPLLERIEQMDARLRLADILSGVFLIIGLAGIALWAKGNRGRT